MRFLSVCSGMEAASVAWEPLGWKAVGFSEIEPFPCAILKHRFPNTPNYGSLTEYQSWPLAIGDVDLLCGGTPCQSYSVAGKRAGLNDPRGQLMLSFLDLAQRLKVRWLVWENVPGVLSSGQPRGSDFATFLQGLVERGYGWAYRVLDAQYVGGPGAVPQRRRRVFVVACLGDWRAPAEVLFKPESLCRNIAKGRKKGQATAPDAGSGVEASGCWWDGGQVSQTLDAVLAKGQTMPEKNRFPAVLQPVCATGEITHCLTKSHQGSEDGTGRGTPIVIDRAAFNQGINAQYEPHIEQTDVMDSLVARGPHAVGQPLAMRESGQGYWMEDDKAGTLRAEGENRPSRPSHVIGQPMPHIVQASELRLRGEIKPQDTCPTLLANTKSGDNDPLAVHAITFQPGNLRREAGADPSTTATTTLKASAGDQMPHVAYPQGVDLYNQTLTGDLHVPIRTAGGHGAPATLQAMAVRRLTPVECERLQGFPDNWSRIPWKGKPEDQCPDGPRYKACGNSMAVPVMRWIGEQIARVELSHNPTNQTNA